MFIFLLCVLFAVFVYYKFVKPCGYWKNKKVSHAPTWPLLGSFGGVLLKRKHFSEVVAEIYRKYPNEKCTGYMQFSRHFLLLRDLETIAKIKESHSFGKRGLAENWAKIFASGENMEKIYALGEERSSNFVENLQTEVEVEMKNFFSKFASDIIALATFGMKIDSLQEPENEFFSMGVNLSRISVVKLFLNDVFGCEIFPKHVTAYFKNLIQNKLKGNEDEINSLLIQFLLENGDLEEEEIVNQILLFVFTSFDTISTASTFLAYELAKNPEIQRKLQREIDATKISYQTLRSMKYLDQVLSEALRLWPPIYQDERTCIKNYEISDPEKPFFIEKGVKISIPIVGIHRDPLYFPEPDRFNPERFNGPKIIPGTYLPFGDCKGSEFAILEIKTLFFRLLSKFDIVPVAKTEIPIKIAKNQVSMSPENGLWLVLKPRDT